MNDEQNRLKTHKAFVDTVTKNTLSGGKSRKMDVQNLTQKFTTKSMTTEK